MTMELNSILSSTSWADEPLPEPKAVNPVEEGFIKSLMGSSGIITCCDRPDELYFHFSQVSKRDLPLSIGQEVRFEIRKQNGTPNACNLITLPKGTVSIEVIDDEIVHGTIERALKNDRGRQQSIGRISFNDESLPFCREDVNQFQKLSIGDPVAFCIVTHRPTKQRGATHIRLEIEKMTNRSQGVIKAVKDAGFGFIECCDQKQELFFHQSNLLPNEHGLVPAAGVEVDFSIVPDNRSDSMVASCIRLLPPGSISYENILPGTHTGRVTKPIYVSERERACLQSNKSSYADAMKPASSKRRLRLPGRVTLKDKTAQFRIEDVVDAQLLCSMDLVEFSLSENKLSKVLRATNIVLKERFNQEGNDLVARMGIVDGMDGDSVTVKSLEEDNSAQLHVNDFVDHTVTLKRGMELEYHVHEGPKGPVALLGKVLPPGTLKVEEYSESTETAVISKAIGPRNQPGTLKPNNSSSSLQFIFNDIDSPSQLYKGDEVTFRSMYNKLTKQTHAKEIQLVTPTPRRTNGFVNFVAENGYGFIQSPSQSDRIFFHLSEVYFPNDSISIRKGDEVDFELAKDSNTGKTSGKNVRILPSGTIPLELISEDVYEGTVTEGLRYSPHSRRPKPQMEREKSQPTTGRFSFGSNKSQYTRNRTPGKLTYMVDGKTRVLCFGKFDIMKEEKGRIYQGDVVRFRIATHAVTGEKTATQLEFTFSNACIVEEDAVIEHGVAFGYNQYKGMGWIQTPQQDSPICFFAESFAQEPAIGVQVAFRRGKRGEVDIAHEIKKFDGVVSFGTVLDDLVTGVVSKTSSFNDTCLFNGTVTLGFPDEKLEQSFAFSELDRGQCIRVGSLVNFQKLQPLDADATHQATNLTAIRRTGQVTQVNENDSTISCNDESISTSHPRLHVGDAVTFLTQYTEKGTTAYEVIRDKAVAPKKLMLSSSEKTLVKPSLPEPCGPDGTCGFTRTRTISNA